MRFLDEKYWEYWVDWSEIVEFEIRVFFSETQEGTIKSVMELYNQAHKKTKMEIDLFVIFAYLDNRIIHNKKFKV